jgi:phenylacetate-CoA ligase
MTAETDVRPAIASPTPRRLPGPVQLRAMELALRGISKRYGALQWFLEVMPPAPADAFATARALRTARYAAKHVPAYRDYLFSLGLEPDNIRSLDDLPETGKRSYADVYPLAERCIGGRLPLMGTTLDESSGSTGKPYNWARSEEERRHVRRMIAFFTRYTFGDEPLVILNTFSMGAWATGLTMAIALEARGLVKATGPDLDKVLDTMVELGPGYRYLVVGYPPFLKVLLDEGTRRGMDWSTYDMQALLGGEGNSEALRDYLLRHFRTVYSGYGVTDVEIGIAAETPVIARPGSRFLTREARPTPRRWGFLSPRRCLAPLPRSARGCQDRRRPAPAASPPASARSHRWRARRPRWPRTAEPPPPLAGRRTRAGWSARTWASSPHRAQPGMPPAHRRRLDGR